MQQQLREGILPLALGTSRVICAVLDSQGAAGNGPVQTTKMLGDLEHLSEESLWELGLVRLERRLRGNFVNINISKGSEYNARLFVVMPRNRRRSNSHKLNYKKFPLNTRKNIPWRGAEHWHRVRGVSFSGGHPKPTWTCSSVTFSA